MTDDIVTTLVLPKLEGVRRNGGYWMARCPAHEDGTASLSIKVGTQQPVILNCHAGCQSEDILTAMGLTWEQVCAPREEQRKGEWTPYGEAVAVYDYTDEDGKLLFQVLRTANKQFPQRVPDATKRSGWRWGTTGTRKVLYRLPRLIQGLSEGDLAWIAEGEKDVQALERAGALATCPPGGSNASVWLPEYTPVFEGALVRIVADRDKAGQAHARRIFKALEGVAAAVEIVEAAVGKDAADHLAAGKTLGEFEMTHQTGDDKPDLALDLYQFLAVADPPENWVMKDFLERGDRLIWTAREGLGKSMVIRQFAVTAAAGIHPFKGTVGTPAKVLVIDAENTERQSRKHYRNLAWIAQANGVPVPEGALRLIHRPTGLNLGEEEDREWLIERVTAHQPDLLIIGPLYKLHALDINEETNARVLVTALDVARIKADCALIVEAHSPKGSAILEPVGSGLFMRWPEFGYGMKAEKNKRDHVYVEGWRGPRDERDFPRQLEWGRKGTRDWPWVIPVSYDMPPPPDDVASRWNGA